MLKTTIASLCALALASFIAANPNQDMQTATGSFEITMTPASDADHQTGRLLIDKVYTGDLEGTGTGQMLSHRTNVPGSAGYVAIEHFTGTLAGRQGTFALQHTGTMDKGSPTLSITVIPDSGTAELKGLSGSLQIDQTDGSHKYTFTYSQ